MLNSRGSTEALEHLVKWNPLRHSLAERIRTACESLARQTPITARDLETILLLHLPRFTAEHLLDETAIRNEAERLLHLTLSKRQGLFAWSNKRKIDDFLREDISFGLCDESIAQVIYERFHYIGACRAGIVHVALYHRIAGDIPMALMTISEMDIEHLKHAFEGKETRALVVSRSYAFDWAPRNSISFLTAKLRRWVRQELPEASLLLSYINPNLGFTGKSYAASGWQMLGLKSMRYRYYRDNYLTYRLMCELPSSERGKVTVSMLELDPLRLLGTRVSGDSAERLSLRIND